MTHDLDTIAGLCARDARLTRCARTDDATLADLGADLALAADALRLAPATSFGCIVKRALLARQLADRDDDGNLAGASSTYAQERAVADLIDAVIAVARREGLLG